MELKDFDYILPPELIAQKPLSQRDASRLMVVDKVSGRWEHRYFYEIVKYLREGDALVLNNTRVIPARLLGVKEGTGANIEVFLLNRIDRDTYEVLVKPGKRVKIGTRIRFGKDELIAEVIGHTPEGGRVVRFYYSGIFEEVLDRLGQVPLPPYITEPLEEKERYQTVYSQYEGSVAAPTAGLHFTEQLLEKVKTMGVEIVFLTLHVGLGTFRPVQTEKIAEHKMHAEFYSISAEAAGLINRIREKGGRVIAVGTTSVRTLETASDKNGMLHPSSGWTDIFIYPGYQFKIVDGMITNFHLPKSTLIMLVSAFLGRGKTLSAYEEAVKERYRFFSFGDAMLIV